MLTNYLTLLIILPVFLHCEGRRGKVRRGLHLKIIGRNKLYPLEKFDTLKYPIDPKTMVVEIENVEIEPSNILQGLQDLKGLDSLILKNVDWVGNFTRKLNFPLLKYFHLRRLEWDFDLSTPEEIYSVLFVKNISILSEIRIQAELGGSLTYFPEEERLILVEDPHNLFKYFEYRDLDLTDCTINSSFLDGRGVKRFSGKRIQGLENGNVSILLEKLDSVVELELYANVTMVVDLNMLPSPLDLRRLVVAHGTLKSSSVQAHLLSNLQQLILKDSTIDVGSISVLRGSINAIELARVSLINVTITSFLLHHTNLTTVKLVANGEPFDVSDLVSSSASMLDLHLENLEAKLTKNVTFPQLDRLTLSNCVVYPSLLHKFSQVFKEVNHILVEGRGKVVNKLLLQQILNTTATRLTFLGFTYWQKGDVIEFVRSAGAPTYLDQIELLKVNGTWSLMQQRRGTRYNTYLRDALIYSYAVGVFAVAALGILGTLTSMAVLVQKPMRSSTSCLLFTLATFDTFVLVSYIPFILMSAISIVTLKLGFAVYYDEYNFFWMRFTFTDSLTLDRWQRFFFYPLCKTAYTGSVYSTVLLTLERYVAVCWPLKAKSWVTIKKSIVASVGVLMFTGLLNLPRWFESDESILKMAIDNNHLNFHRYYKKGSWLRRQIYMEFYQGWIWVAFLYVIPVSLLSVLNLRIWQELRSSTARRRQMSHSSEPGGVVTHDAEDELRGITKMLLTVVAVFLACSVVNATIFLNFFGIEPMAFESLASIPLIFNSSINFLIYTIAGEKFRRNLISMFPCLCSKVVQVERHHRSSTMRSTRSSSKREEILSK